MKSYISILVAILTAAIAPTSVHGQYWSRTYFRGYHANSIQQTIDGGFIVAGEGSSDIWITKLDIDGYITWQKTYGGSESDTASAIQQTIDSGFIIAGSTQSFGEGGYDIWILKLDTDGNVIWQKSYGGSEFDTATAIQETMDGGYIVAGKGSGDIWIAKLDIDGNVIWQKSYEGDSAHAIQQTNDGGFIFGGYYDFGNLLVAKVDPIGNIDWYKLFEGYLAAAMSVQPTADGGFIVAGRREHGGGKIDFYGWILKLDSRGSATWQKTYSRGTNVGFDSIQQTTDMGFILAGTDCSTYLCSDRSVWVLKIDSSGEMPGRGCVNIAETAIVPADIVIQPNKATAVSSLTGASPRITGTPPIDIDAGIGLACDSFWVRKVPRYRLYNPNNGQHHYTTDDNENDVLKSLGWDQEGAACNIYNAEATIDSADSVPYYRLYNPYTYEHHWTTDSEEYNNLTIYGWIQEGIDGHVFASQVTGSEPLYRLYNPYNGHHHWTMTAHERNVLLGYGWVDEGIACYVFSD